MQNGNIFNWLSKSRFISVAIFTIGLLAIAAIVFRVQDGSRNSNSSLQQKDGGQLDAQANTLPNRVIDTVSASSEAASILPIEKNSLTGDGDAPSPPAGEADQEFLKFVGAQQLAYRALYGKLSYEATLKSHNYKEQFKRVVDQTQHITILRRGTSSLVTLEMDTLLEEREQRDSSGKKLPSLFIQSQRPSVMKALVTDELMVVWMDVSKPLVKMTEAKEWVGTESGHKQKGSTFWAMVDINRRCFSFDNSYLEDSLRNPIPNVKLTLREKNAGFCVITRATKRTPQDLLLKLNTEHGGLLMHAEFTPPVGAKATVDISYKESEIEGQVMRVPENYKYTAKDAVDLIDDNTEILFSNFSDESGKTPFVFEDLGLPRGALVCKSYPNGSWQYFQLQEGGGISEVTVEEATVLGLQPLI